MKLRNHDENCKHGYKTSHTIATDYSKWLSGDPVECYGGEEVETHFGVVSSSGVNKAFGHGPQGPWVHITVQEDMSIGTTVGVIEPKP